MPLLAADLLWRLHLREGAAPRDCLRLGVGGQAGAEL